jgi:hypothetical protein
MGSASIPDARTQPVKRTGLFLTLALLALFAPTATADKPLKEPLPPPEDAVHPACPFPLGEEVLSNRGKSITLSATAASWSPAP